MFLLNTAETKSSQPLDALAIDSSLHQQILNLKYPMNSSQLKHPKCISRISSMINLKVQKQNTVTMWEKTGHENGKVLKCCVFC